MPDIDLIRHSCIGLIAGVPIYLCHEDGCWLGRTPYEPSSVAKKSSLSIGGGGGEHPAAVIFDTAACVSYYLSEDCPLPKIVYCEGVEKSITSSFGFAPNEIGFAEWLVSSIGEFLFFMMPDLNDDIASLRRLNSDITTPYLTSVTIPWWRYEGNRSSYWNIEKAQQIGGGESPTR